MRVGLETSVTEVTKGGTSVYIKELGNALRSLDQADDFIDIKYTPILRRGNKINKVLDTIHRDFIWTLLFLNKRVVKEKLDILHCPFPWAAQNLPCKLVVTIHDVAYSRYPENMTGWMSFSMNKMIPRTLKRADKIIANSQFTKLEYLELYPWLNENQIIVTHLGTNSMFTMVAKESLHDIQLKYSITSRFILSVCTLEPRKNLKRLLQAFALVKDKIDHDFILAGAYGWKNKELYSIINSLGIASRVKFIGHVPLNDLVKLYNLADMFAYVSIYEGFGIPPLEAMACGCPVISSNNTSLPEVVGDAAYKIDPFEMEDIANAIQTLANDEDLKKKYSEQGLVQAKIFSWEKCAQQTLEVYQTLC